MFVLFLALLNVLMLFFIFSSFSDKKRIFVTLAESGSVFLCLYSIISAALWVFEVFSVEFCLLTVTIVVTVVFMFAYYKSRKRGTKFFAVAEIKIDYGTLVNRIIIVIATLLSVGAYSTFGIGFNDGNAQVQALSIVSGQRELNFEIDEYENIEPESRYKYYFYDRISDFDTDNFTANYRLLNVDTQEGKVEKMIGEFGSNPVYPSILSLSAILFGIKRMSFIQAVFAFCLFVFVDEILRELKCDWKLRSVLVMLLGVSPEIVYCNHTTLIEPIIGFCMIVFMYFLLCKKGKQQMLSVLGAITFAFLHTSVYTMLPLFLILYWIYFVHTGKIRHLLSSGLMIIGYVLSFGFLNIVAPENTAINYKLGIPFLGEYYYLFVIIISVLAVVFGVFLSIVMKKFASEKLAEFKKNAGKRIFKILMAIFSAAVIPVTIIVVIQKCYTFQNFLSVTIISFTVCTGVLLIPYILFRLISTKYNIGIKEASVVFAFVYTVILYSCVMKVMLKGYYYEARYISSFIPFVIILAGMMLRLLKKEEKYFIPIIGIIVLLTPYTTFLLGSDVETRFDKEMLEDVTEIVSKNVDKDTVVFVEKNLLKYLYFPVKYSTDANVYPIEPTYIEAFCKGLNDYDSKVIYITNNEGDKYSERGKELYINNNIQKKPFKVEASALLGLPYKSYDRDCGTLQILEMDSLYYLLDYNLYPSMDISDIDLSVNNIEIDDNGIAHINVSLSDGTKMYRNERFNLSYHLEYENEEDVYDLPRTEIGSLVLKNYMLDVDLDNQPEDVTVVIDIVEEGVQWYSWKNKVPVIVFTKNDDSWNYNIYKFYTKLK